MARATTVCRIASEFVPMIYGERDLKVMWDRLANAHKSKCQTSVNTLQNRLLNTKMSPGMSIRSFVNEMCTIECQLAFAGKLVDEDDKKYALLYALRTECNFKKTNLQESYEIAFEAMIHPWK